MTPQGDNSCHQGRSLGDIFVAITGQSELVESQVDQHEPPEVAAEEDAALTNFLVRILREDGLAETYDIEIIEPEE